MGFMSRRPRLPWEAVAHGPDIAVMSSRESVAPTLEAVHQGTIRKSRGALFVVIVKRACADRGISAPVGQPLHAIRT